MAVDHNKKDMDIDNKGEEEQKGKPVMVILVGAPGSGKSTFCERVMGSSLRPWTRICQDTINNGKAGTKPQCLKRAAAALKEGKSVFIDRCNLDKEQRSDFVKLGCGAQVDAHAVVLDLPAKLCISRSIKRTGHEGNLQGGKAAAVVNRMLQKKELPKLNEGFARIVFCHNENDVEATITAYTALGPLDTLSNGCFGQKNPDAKIQLGIMKFLKKVEAPFQCAASKEVKESENLAKGSVDADVSVDEITTLAFPSISTADFQFNNETASDIIVEKVEEFVNKLKNARLVLVDLRGLRCNVIANAANWRLKPGGGGVNAAIFTAAGLALETATKERANSLLPGHAVVVPLPSDSPLYTREGVSHVIHVLGPNMNPQRPNSLNNDYNKGCSILREAYTSLFTGFLSILRSRSKLPRRISEKLALTPLDLKDPSLDPRNHLTNSDQKIKRDDGCVYERSKKCKGANDETVADISAPSSTYGKVTGDKSKLEGPTSKTWGSWAQALYHIAMHPEKHKAELLEVLDDVLVLNDLYPKACKHLLVLARHEGLDGLADVHQEHLQLLMTMHAVGLKWAEKLLHEDSSMVFRLGYHLAPSMRQLHLHVISQDFNSNHLKNKKHWNSFNTAFFRDSVDVIEEIKNHGKATIKDEDFQLSMELRCHRCRSAHPNIPRLKSHISICQAPFPHALLENGHLVLALKT
ncbi:hypothetical protein OIU77_017365 [Salix suchowensis]|uniref:Macro domain-containing protein n=1 Tax=Salix suchowensis TaxID=1278906 RepID=A0ABQ8ZP01_9ROSI|nr:hypothetical protein OIU77_017365 [Salix suchowensis]